MPPARRRVWAATGEPRSDPGERIRCAAAVRATRNFDIITLNPARRQGGYRSAGHRTGAPQVV